MTENQVLSVIYEDYSRGSTTFGEIAGGWDAPYNHSTLVVVLRQVCGWVTRGRECVPWGGRFSLIETLCAETCKSF